MEAITRMKQPVEEILVQVSGEHDRPLEKVSFFSRDNSEETWQPLARARPLLDPEETRFPELLGRGLNFDFKGKYILPIYTSRENEFMVKAETYLPAFVNLPGGEGLSGPLVMKKGALVQGIFKDIDNERVVGDILVSWKPLDKENSGLPRVLHGVPFSVSLEYGELKSNLFPPGRNNFTFLLMDSEAQAEKNLYLRENSLNRLGIIKLGETRSITGNVLLSDGLPAPDVLVSLVKPGEAYRYPTQDLNPRDQPYSARTDPLGNFQITGLPLDLEEELALVAHLEGWTDAVEEPVDLLLQDHTLMLEESSRLNIIAHYGDGLSHEDYQFRLEYSQTSILGQDIFGAPIEGIQNQLPEGTISIGAISPTRSTGDFFENCTSGYYRLIWDLVDSHPSLQGRMAEAAVYPGSNSRLALRITDPFLTGEALFNGKKLRRGWVLLSDNPEDPNASTIGRVIDGHFELPFSSRSSDVHVCLIPQIEPLPMPNFFRGEILPKIYPRFRLDTNKKFLHIHYQAYNFTYQLPSSIYQKHPDLEIEYPHYIWGRSGYQKELRREPLNSNIFKLNMIPPGRFNLRIISSDGYRHINRVDVYGDTHITLGQ